MEQLYLDVAAGFQATEISGDFTTVYDPDKDTIKSMSETLLDWAAEARQRLTDYHEAVARSGRKEGA